MERIVLQQRKRENRLQKSRKVLSFLSSAHRNHTVRSDGMVKSAFRDLQKAVLQGDDLLVEQILSELQTSFISLLNIDIEKVIDMCEDIMEEGVNDILPPDERVKSSSFYYILTVIGYIEILRSEINWFRGNSFPALDLAIFLRNPLSYVTSHNRSLLPSLKQEVSVGGGRSYQTAKNFSKIGLNVLVSSIYELLAAAYKRRGAVGYIGFRNGDYPCAECDYYAGKLMPIDNMVYPLHINCICGWYEVYSDEVISD